MRASLRPRSKVRHPEGMSISGDSSGKLGHTRTRNSETPEDMRNIIFGEQERGLRVSGGSELRSGSVTPQAAVEEAGSPIGWISERDARVLSLEGS